MMKLMTALLVALTLSGCISTADVERADDRACATARDYAICRQNIMSQRRDAAIRSQ